MANIAFMKNDIPFESLPKASRDAITVVRAFSLRYLW
jgi:hypothetical protein